MDSVKRHFHAFWRPVALAMQFHFSVVSRGIKWEQTRRQRSNFVEAVSTLEEGRKTGRWLAIAVALDCAAWGLALAFWFEQNEVSQRRVLACIVMSASWVLWLAIVDTNMFPEKLRSWMGSLTVVANLYCVWFLLAIVDSHLSTGMETNTLAALTIVPLVAGSIKGGLLVVYWIGICALAHICLTAIRLSTEPSNLISQEEILSVNVASELFLTFLAAWLVSRIQARLNELREAQSLWAAMLSRDIRTPLHGLLATSETLLLADGDVQSKDALDTIQGCARMITAILDNLLETTSSTPTAEFGKFISIKDLERDLTLMARAISGARTCTLCVENETSSELTFLAVDAAVVIEVMGNILSNAVKFSPANSNIDTRITLTPAEVPALTPYNNTSLRDGVPCNVEIAIEDAGTGVPLELRENIFLPFERGLCVTPSSRGIGLGLSIVRETVQTKLNGTVLCTGRRDGARGARFVINFPSLLGASPSTAFHSAAGTPLASMAEGRNFDLVRVLIVDDNHLNVRILKRFLVRAGIREDNIVEAASAELAIETVDSTTDVFDIAILDLVLPGMDGIDLALAFRTSLHKCPHIMIGASASLTPDVQKRWRLAGVHYQISKPFSTDVIANMLDRCFGHSSGIDMFVEHPNRVVGHHGVSDMLLDAQRRQLALSVVHFYFVLRAILLVLSGSRLIWQLLAVVGFATFVTKHTLAQTSKHRLVIGCGLGFVASCFRPTLLGLDHYTGFIAWPVFLGLVFGDQALKLFVWLFPLAYAGLIFFYSFGAIPLLAAGTTRFENEAQSLLTFCITSFMMLNILALLAVADDARIRWANTLSHDLRTPLHGIAAAVTDLEEAAQFFSKDASREAVRTMRACTLSLLGITDTVLSLAVPEHQRDIDTLNIRQYLGNVVDMAKTVVSADKLEFDPPSVDEFDVVRLQTHFLWYASAQLCSYLSIFCSTDSRVIVSVSLESSPAHRRNSFLTLRLRESVSQRSAPDMRRLSRTWLVDTGGESTLSRVVKQLGGTMGYSVNEDGTWLIWIRIPCISLDADESLGPITRSTVQSLSICVVDDNQVNLNTFQKMLGRVGVDHVATYQSAARALAALDSGLLICDIVFVDLQMPDLNGFEFAYRVARIFAGRQQQRPLMVACTASANTEIIAQCLAAGMPTVLHKPFSTGQLKTVLHTLNLH